VYLEDGLHRAVRAALRNRTVLHARVFDMDTGLIPPAGPPSGPPSIVRG
jgi:hypothetical protein